MTARIDHAAKAIEIVNGIKPTMQIGQGRFLIAGAQVHATLALVEQQRIANLIAVAKWNDAALKEGARRTDDAEVDYDAERARVDSIFTTVREGLGL